MKFGFEKLSGVHLRLGRNKDRLKEVHISEEMEADLLQKAMQKNHRSMNIETTIGDGADAELLKGDRQAGYLICRPRA